ncbi:MAG TPA: NCS2 family permease [Actinomycetota bacterium]|nr:NCS2 family permease [Actinomycetota bacterium]
MALDAWAPPKPSSSGTGGLDRFFHITERGSNVRTELIAGLATWLTMSYILFVNPQILGSVADGAGVKLAAPQVAAVTALVACVMTLLMGLYANYPFALAAGLGLNAFVAFTLVGTHGLSWPEAMGVILVEGLIITILVLTGFREAVLNAIPMDLKRAIGVGIGLFIAFIGFVNSGVVVHPEAGTIVTLNPDLTTLRILIFAIGLAVTMVLVSRRIRGALLIGIVFTTVLASIINAIWGDGRLYPPGVAELPSDFISAPDLGLLGNVSLGWSGIAIGTLIGLILGVMLSDFFDTMGTVVGLAGEAGLLDKDGNLPGVNRVLLVDSLAAAAGGAASSSSNTTYIESAAGISEGGRTGLTSVVVALLFFLSLFFSPWAGVIPPEATAPVLIIVGYFMMTLVREIAWNDPAIGIPALLAIIVQPFTFSITNGVGAGFIAYTVIRLFQGRFRDIHPLMFVASVVFMWYFLGTPGL